jgi:hypothetical protein
MTAPDGDIYYTLDGTDPKLPDGAISPSAISYTDPITIEQDALVRARALSGDEWSVRNDAQFEVVAVQPTAGDFDADGDFDCDDIDTLVQQILENGNDDLHDLNNDGDVNTNDIDAWLAIAGAANLPSGSSFLRGDANLDGAVNPADVSVISLNWLLTASGWCAGDFNADGVVNTVDLNEVGLNWRMDVSGGPPQGAPISRAPRAPLDARSVMTAQTVMTSLTVITAQAGVDTKSDVELGDDAGLKSRTMPVDADPKDLGTSANVAVRRPFQERRYRRLANSLEHQQDDAEIADEVFAVWHAI